VAVTAFLTDMSQPLGRMCGHAVEVNETLDILAGKGPADVTELTFRLGGELLTLARIAPDLAEGQKRLREAIDRGAGLEKFREMVASQGGNLDVFRHVAPAHDIVAPRAGYIAAIDTEQLGWAIVLLGGGRRKAGDAVDHSVGLEKLASVGQRVERGEPILRVFAPQDRRESVEQSLINAYTISDEPPRELVAERIA
jgi:thymidine phosphorylase